jgi:hypothetical protein
MKKLIVIISILMLFSITAFAELSDGAKANIEILKAKYINEEVEDIEKLIKKLKYKLYTLTGSVIEFDDTRFYDGISINIPVIEVVDISLNVLMQLKGWEIWINDKCYYVLLVEKGD